MLKPSLTRKANSKYSFKFFLHANNTLLKVEHGKQIWQIPLIYNMTISTPSDSHNLSHIQFLTDFCFLKW